MSYRDEGPVSVTPAPADADRVVTRGLTLGGKRWIIEIRTATVKHHGPGRRRIARAIPIAGGWVLLAGLVGLGWWFEARGQEAPSRPSEEATVAAPVVDDFDRDAPGALSGPTASGANWLGLGAGFDVADGTATVADGGGDVSIALIRSSTADSRVEAEVVSAPAGTGLIFRYQDLFNYWSLVSVPEYATWNLILTVDGQPGGTWPVGLSSTEPGTRIAVDADGAEIRVFVNGELKLTVLDETLQDAPGAGIASLTGSGAAIDRFAVTPHQSPTP